MRALPGMHVVSTKHNILSTNLIYIYRLKSVESEKFPRWSCGGSLYHPTPPEPHARREEGACPFIAMSPLPASVIMGGLFGLAGYLALLGLACLIKASDSRPERLDRRLAPDVNEMCARIPDKEVDRESTCPICLDLMELGDLVKQLHCKHCYHSSCLEAWLRSNGKRVIQCPMCRQAHTNSCPEDLNCGRKGRGHNTSQHGTPSEVEVSAGL